MRLRNIPGAKDAIAESAYVIQNPQENAGKWHEIFQNGNPVHIEVSMEKELENQKAETDEILHKMEKYYEAHHEEMAQKLYDKILRM